MDDHLFFSSTSSSLFDTYLIYGIIGLLIFIAIIGLIVLLATSCCFCYSCLSPTSYCFCCYRNYRHSSYKLRQKSNNSNGIGDNNNKKKISFIRRHPSDVADFSQLYESCPHLINSKAMTTTSTNMETSCTTIDTLISPISVCSSFRSFVQSGTLTKDIKPLIIQNDLSNLSQENNVNVDKTNIISSSSIKGACSRPFSYIKNTNDRAQILRRFNPHDRSIPETIDVTRISSSNVDDNNQINSTCTNIYETVIPTTNNNISTSDVSIPIYETEWTHNLRQLMISTTTTTSAIENENISVIELPSEPLNLVPSTEQTVDYFQQQNPYDTFLSSRSTTSDSMRRANMLRRLKDDAAFLY